MNKPVLVVMAAGMGSRYGGMKQIDPVGPKGQPIVEYSLYDAHRAGFETVIFVIKHEIEEAFKAAIGDRVSQGMNVKYAFQQLDELPAGFTIPEGRVKPWGTCHGTVSRGVCVVNPDGTLHSVTERTGIETYEGGIRCTSLTGEGTDDLPVEAPVSMNLWGFGKSFLDEADRRFAGWLRENLPKNPLKCEYFLPTVASELIDEGKAAVTVLKSTDKWYGVTYREDKPTVVAAIAQKTQEGLYPEDLWA